MAYNVRMKIETDKTMEVGGLPIRYDRVRGQRPGVVFLGGYTSTRNGEKARALWQWAQRTGRSFVRFDYSGHGDSGGDFAEGTLGRWLAEALAVIDRLSDGPQVVVGSSMGGWLALLAGVARPEKIKAVLTVACAADFTERVILQALPPQALEELKKTGVIYKPDPQGGEPLPVTWRFVKEAKNHLLLNGPIHYRGPVHLLHGTADADIPLQTSVDAHRLITSKDKTLETVEGGDHQLSTPKEIERMIARLEHLLADQRF